VVTRWGFKTTPLFDPKRGPVIVKPGPSVVPDTIVGSMNASKETSVKRHGETEDDPALYPEHGMPLEEADAKQARIESWVHTTQIAQNASTSISPAMGTG
jgi:hypothetical protein